MESVNVVVDDFCNFSKFYKEDAISSLIEEAGEEVTADQSIATPNNTEIGPSEPVAIANKPETGTIKPVAIEDDQKIDSRNSKEVSLDVLTESIRKEPSSRVKKNHP